MKWDDYLKHIKNGRRIKERLGKKDAAKRVKYGLILGYDGRK